MSPISSGAGHYPAVKVRHTLRGHPSSDSFPGMKNQELEGTLPPSSVKVVGLKGDGSRSPGGLGGAS